MTCLHPAFPASANAVAGTPYLPMETEPSAFPVDYDKLDKGDIIPAQVVCDFYGIQRSSRAYALVALRFAEQVKLELSRRGKNVVIRSDHDDLRILTDEEAVDYTEREYRAGLRKAARRNADARRIDVANLTSDAAQRLDRALIIQAAQLSALAGARRAVLSQERKELT
jgi:hypothetical protein